MPALASAEPAPTPSPAPSPGTDWSNFAVGSAPEATIIAGGKACIGTTAAPGSQTARIAGWTPVTGDARAKMDTQGDVVTKDNVMLIYQTGIDGGCVVITAADPPVDPGNFYARLGAAIEVPVPAGNGKDPPQVKLPNGELMIVVVAPEDKRTRVVLVFANTAGVHLKGKS